LEDLAGKVKVYRLKRDENVVVIGGFKGRPFVMNLRDSRPQFEALREREALVFEQDSTDNLRVLLSENSKRVDVGLPDEPHEIFVHLAGFVSPDKALTKRMFANLFFHLDQRMNMASEVVLVSDDAERRLAFEAVSEQSLKHAKQFVAVLSPGHENYPQAHLVSQNALTPELKQAYTGAFWAVVEAQELLSREVNVFSFGRVSNYLEILARIQTQGYERAYAFFLEMEPSYKDQITTLDQFKELVQDPALAAKYPIHALLKTDLQQAIKLYLLSRVIDWAA
jgi:hypothetical protein